MASSSFLLAIPPAALAALSAYTGYYSYISISDVQTYEEQTKKAAEYSNIAEDMLRQTRTTEGAGAIATLLSLISSAGLVIYCIPFSDIHNAQAPSKSVFVALGAINAIATLAARAHIHGYWRGKKKIPFVKNFNEAISTTNLVRVLLGYLGTGWIATGVLGLALGG